MDKYGFTVRECRTWNKETARPGDKNGLWRVYLPHSCDEWMITDGGWQGNPREEAITALGAFILEAQEALAALVASQEFGEDA